tara:strand:- start:177 stop:302 length:126 start_codon:yes stop_codon:yes gene_type:complete
MVIFQIRNILERGLKLFLLKLIIVDEAMHQAQFTKAAQERA